MATALTATLRADITQFERAIAQAETKITGLQRSTTQVNRELAKFGNDFGGATLIRQANSMAKAVEDIGGVTKLTTAEQKKLGATVDEALAKYRSLGQEVPPALVKVSSALDKIREAEEQAQRGAEALSQAQKRAANEQAQALQNVAKAQQQLSTNLNTIGSGLTRSGAILTAAITAPIVAGFGLSIKAAKDFESAFANVVKTVEGLDVDNFGKLNSEAQKLSGEIRTLAKEIPVAATELASIAAIGGQFGVSRDSLVKFTETVAKLGVAVDGISAEEAAAAIAQIGKVAGLAEGDFERLASSIVDLGNTGNSTEGEILELSKRFAGAGAAAGLSAAEIAGISAAIANVGINAEAGGTAISKTFNDIGAAAARGGADLDAFARIAGKSSGEFAKLFKDDAVQAVDLFIGGLRRARDAGTDLTILLDSVGIKEVRQSDTLRRLAGDYENFSKTVDQSRNAFEKNTALAEEARKKFATFGNQLQLFQNRITDIGIELGGPLLQGLRGVLDAADPVVDAVAAAARAFAGMSDEGKLAVVTLVGAAGLAPAILLVAGQALQATSSVIEFTKALKGIQAAQAATQAAQAATAVNGLGVASSTAAASLLGRAGLVGGLLAVGVAAHEGLGFLETQLAESAKGLNGAQKSLSEFIDQWNVLQNTALGSTVGPAAPLVFLVDNLDKAVDLARELKGLIPEIPGFGGRAQEAVPDPSLPTPPGRRTTDIELSATGLPTEDELLARLGILPKGRFEPHFKSAREEIAALKAAIDSLSPSTKQEIEDLRSLGRSVKEISEQTGVAEAVVKAYSKTSAAAAKDFKDAAAEAKKLADESKKLSTELDKLTGRDAIARAKEYQVTLSHMNINNLKPEKAREVNKVFAEAIETAERLGDIVPEVWRDIELSTRQPIKATQLFTDGLYKAQPAIKGLGLEMDKQTERMVLGLMNVKGSVEALNGEFLKQPLNSGDWSESINDLGQAFSNLAQIGGDAFGGIAKQIGEVIALMGVGAQAGKQFRETFFNPTAGAIDPKTGKPMGRFDFSALGGGQGTGAAISAYTNLATTGVAAYGALDQATNVKGRGNRAARGALTGAAIGNSIVPGYGALVGAAVGALVGAFRNPAFEDVYNRVAKNFGVKLSDETAKGIAKVSKDLFKGDRSAAEIFSLDTIIGEGGGIKSSNIDKLTARLRDAFSMKEVGKFSADQLTDVLTKNFGNFADFVGKSTEIAGKGFAEIARLAKAAGVNIESIKAFVGQQTARVGGGLSDLAGPLLEAAGLSEQIKAAKAAQQAAAEAVSAARGGKSDEDLGVGDRQALDAAEQAQAAAAQALADITAKMAAGTKDAQAEFDRLGIIAVGAFNAARASGLGYLDAVDQLSPGLDRMNAIQAELGLTGNAAFAELSKFRDLVSGNETLVASAEALNETILGLSNIGGLTVETLAAMEGQGVETFERLTAAGFTSGQSIEIMRGFIENLQKAHEQLGVPIDANTQSLIDQANALEGLAPKSPTEALTKGFENVVTAVNRLAKGLGIDVPEAANAAAAAVEGATKRSSSAAVDAAEMIARKGGQAWESYERQASASQDEVSDRIRDAAERGINSYKRLADAANIELSRIDREVDIRFRYSQTGEIPGGGGEVPGLASGGVVRARSGGTIVRLGEGGRDEAVVPLPAGPNQGVSVPMLVAALSKIQFTGTLEGGGRPLLRYVSREIGDFIQTRTGQRVPI